MDHQAKVGILVEAADLGLFRLPLRILVFCPE